MKQLALIAPFALLAMLILAACGRPEGTAVTSLDDGETAAQPTVQLPEASPTRRPSATATISATPTAIDTLSPTDTPEPTDTPVPTATPWPTSSPTPTATPPPPGFVLSQPGGFSLVHPDYWQIMDDEYFQVTLVDNTAGLYLGISGFIDQEALPADEVFDQFVAGLESSDYDVRSRDQTMLGDSLTAERAVIAVENPGPLDLAFHLLYARQEPRTYFLVVSGTQAAIEFRQPELESLYGTFELFNVYLFGLDRDQTLVWLGGDPQPEDLDPVRGWVAGYVGMLYSGLVRLTPQLTVEPSLAESWQIDGSGTVYTFTLRAGLTFGNGRPLTAYDVKYSWERAADPQTNAQGVRTYLGDIVGVTEKIDGLADEIAGVEVIDDLTLRVTLDAPKPYFLVKLTYSPSFVVDRYNVEMGGERWMYAPNPSGPYGLRQYLQEEALIFERNQNYHAPAKIPFVVYLVNRFGTPLSMYEAGEIDRTGLSPGDIDRVRQPSDSLHDQWLTTTSLCTTMINFDNQQPPMDDIIVRQAFAMAVDKTTMAERFGEGRDLIAVSILPPGMPGHVERSESYIFDPAAAQALLAASKYGDEMPPITISTLGYGDEEDDFSIALANMWQETLGIEYTVEYLDPVNYTKAAAEEHGQLVVWGWCADYPDPENFLDVLFNSESEYNLTSYHHEEVDRLLEQARSEFDPQERLRLYQEIEKMLILDVAAIPLDHSVSHLLVSPRIKGYVLAPMGVAQTDLIWINPEFGSE